MTGRVFTGLDGRS